MTDRELMQQALDALIDAADSQSWVMQQNIDQHGEWYRRSMYLKQATKKSQEAIEALRARLAEPKQERTLEEIATTHEVEWMKSLSRPQREWQGLTDEEIKEIIGPWGDQPVKGYTRKLFDQIEAKLKGKNG